MGFETLISADQIRKRVAELGREISADFSQTEMIALIVLKGSMFFAADLLREMTIDHAIDVIQVSSYGKEKYSSGVVTILKEPQLDMKGRGVLILEDIIDSGYTIREVFRYIESRGAKPVKVASFLDKPASRKVAFVPDYIGFTIEPHFVVGYGLDYAEKYRNLPDVRILTGD
ncbi:MAG TPA: hypoxanthine phosphoribosyltransferase [Thermoanaerobaculia bacterium]|nr:hypoxanthine phosphoribosyltransferase [Thermoanaerobaculia bacterium]